MTRIIPALERLTFEIADRIRLMCAHLSEAELISLAGEMAVIELKYMGHASPTLGERRRHIVVLLKNRRRAE